LLWLFLTQTNVVAAYFLMPARLWEMVSLSVPRDQVLKRNIAYYDMLKRLRKRYPAFRIFYAGNHFCTPTTCRSDWWGRPLFQTRDHLTPYGSSVLAAELKPLLLRLLQVSEASRNQP
jgi:hypothetical protein